MTKSEMLKNWKNTSAIKSQFGKVLGERYPHLCYTDTKLLDEVNTTLQRLTEKLSAVKDGTPEVKAKAEKKSEDAPASETAEATTKIADGEVQVKAGAKKSAKAEAKQNAVA